MIVDKMLRDVARKVFIFIFCWTEGEGGNLALCYKSFYVRNKFLITTVTHFHPSLTFAGKAGAYPSVGLSLKPFSQILDKGGSH
jgi:hypothetical protein